jgi:PAS domain-containing protein
LLKVATVSAEICCDAVSVAEPLIQASLLGEALDNGPVAVFVFDEDMRYVAANADLCALLGYARDELLLLRVSDEVLVNGTGRRLAWLRRKDGGAVELEYAARETTIAGMMVYVAVGWAA